MTTPEQEKIQKAAIRRARRADRPNASKYSRLNVRGGMRRNNPNKAQ